MEIKIGFNVTYPDYPFSLSDLEKITETCIKVSKSKHFRKFGEYSLESITVEEGPKYYIGYSDVGQPTKYESLSQSKIEELLNR